MVLSCLPRSWIVFQRQQTKIKSMQPKHAQKRKLWPPAAPGTKVSSFPHVNIIITWMMESFQRQGSVVQEDPVLMTLSYKWPSSKVLQLKLSHQHFYIPGPQPLKNLILVQRTRWIWGIVKASILLVGAFLMNKHFFTPNSEILSFGLLNHWAHRFRLQQLIYDLYFFLYDYLNKIEKKISLYFYT